MRHRIPLLLIAAALPLSSACYAAVRPGYLSGSVVYTAPPPAPVYVRPAAPYPNAVWIDGYWNWQGGRYVWMDGSWASPRAGYYYSQPTWVRRDRGWVHRPGGWVRGGGRGAVIVHQGPTRGQVRREVRREIRREERQERRYDRRQDRREQRYDRRQDSGGGVRVVPGRMPESPGNRPSVQVRKSPKA